MARRLDQLDLGPFLRELDARLGSVCADELRAILRRHASGLELKEREGFLEIFAPPGKSAAPKAAGAKLLADVDSFVGGVGGGRGPDRAWRRRHR